MIIIVKFNGSKEEAYRRVHKMASEVTLEELVEIMGLPPVEEMKKKRAAENKTSTQIKPRILKEQWLILLKGAGKFFAGSFNILVIISGHLKSPPHE